MYHYRGKATGHDVDILISHPAEGKVEGCLSRLLASLAASDVLLHGRHEASTYRDEVLTTNSKLTLRGQLDHFEKWIGILKVPNSVRKQAESSSHNASARNVSCCHCSWEFTRWSDTCVNCGSGKDKTIHELSRNEETLEKNKSSKSEPNISGDASCDSKPPENESCESTEDSIDPSIASVSYDDPSKVLETRGAWTARRVDLIVAPYSQYFYALVGWTGSKQFNRDVRTYADRELGMRLSSHGLYDCNKVSESTNHFNFVFQIYLGNRF